MDWGSDDSQHVGMFVVLWTLVVLIPVKQTIIKANA